MTRGTFLEGTHGWSVGDDGWWVPLRAMSGSCTPPWTTPWGYTVDLAVHAAPATGTPNSHVHGQPTLARLATSDNTCLRSVNCYPWYIVGGPCRTDRVMPLSSGDRCANLPYNVGSVWDLR